MSRIVWVVLLTPLVRTLSGRERRTWLSVRRKIVAKPAGGDKPFPTSSSSQVPVSCGGSSGSAQVVAVPSGRRPLGSDAVTAPPPLTVAASLAAVEGVFLLGYGVAEAVATASARWVMGASTAFFFAVAGAGLMLAAWGLTRGWSLARGPVLLAQLIALGVAWSFRGGGTTPVAVVLAIVAGVILAGLLHPDSVRALSDESDGG